MDKIIYHNFGENKEPPRSEEDGAVDFVESSFGERSGYAILARQSQLAGFFKSIVGWGNSPETMSIRRDIVAKMSDKEVLDILFDSNEALWKKSPSYYAAIWGRVDAMMLEKSSVYRRLCGDSEHKLELLDSDEDKAGTLSIMEIGERFTEDFNVPPMDSYISYFDTSTVGEMDKDSHESEKDKPCLIVKLRDKLPKGMSIPDIYKGVRVFVS